LRFSNKEIEFLLSMEATRFATCHDNIPHVKPVSYIFHQGNIMIATDYDTRSFQNIKKNPHAAIVIDWYKSGAHKAVVLQGKVDIIENGIEFLTIYQLFFNKFKWVQDDPWRENEAPFLKIVPTNKSSWGIN
jgi:nitroimidazol reductase NimA-like FMN-containing flavoprotein (pyridoxamine 5'-phosphate oxidase superfamily)